MAYVAMNIEKGGYDFEWYILNGVCRHELISFYCREKI